MRTIKFRGWDTKENKLISGEAMSILDIYLDPLSGHLVDARHRYPDGSVDIWDFNRYVPMQFTGLLDRNGTEIYEGDIVELKTPYKLPSFLSRKRDIDGKYAVTWGYAGFQYERAPQALSIMNDTLDMGRHPHEIKIEVIGNIYENGDFLK